jgi:hypothetical protein
MSTKEKWGLFFNVLEDLDNVSGTWTLIVIYRRSSIILNSLCYHHNNPDWVNQQPKKEEEVRVSPSAGSI